MHIIIICGVVGIICGFVPSLAKTAVTLFAACVAVYALFQATQRNYRGVIMCCVGGLIGVFLYSTVRGWIDPRGEAIKAEKARQEIIRNDNPEPIKKIEPPKPPENLEIDVTHPKGETL